jgi:hypothetical protein
MVLAERNIEDAAFAAKPASLPPRTQTRAPGRHHDLVEVLSGVPAAFEREARAVRGRAAGGGPRGAAASESLFQ